MQLIILWLCLISIVVSYRNTTLVHVNQLLQKHPIIDGHNDFPLAIHRVLNNNIHKLNFDEDLRNKEPWASYDMHHTDLPRMRKGHVGGQFWVSYVPCDSQYKDAPQKFLEQIDLIKQMVQKYPKDLFLAKSSKDIKKAMKKGYIASLIAVESGHAISSSMALLRTLYDVGTRYMTLTHNCNTPWADAAQAEEGKFPMESNGLSPFGIKLILEMNRLGMMVDISHVTSDTMRKVLATSLAPVIFSHSSARAVTANTHMRNVPDDVIKMVKTNNGIIMVNFYSCYIVDDCEKRNANVHDVVKHINHIRRLIGVNHIGIGADYNGVKKLPDGLSDVSGYPTLFAELLEDEEFEWTDEDLRKLANGNIIRVFEDVEKVRDFLHEKGVFPDNTIIPFIREKQCHTEF